MRLVIRKPSRLEMPAVRMIKERWEARHELLLLGEEESRIVDLERGYWRESDERIDRLSVLRSMKISPSMPERPRCASIPPEPECRPQEFEPLSEDVIDVIMNTERWRADREEFLSAALFEAEEGYILIYSMESSERKLRYVEYIEAERLVGVSVIGEIHSYDPINGYIVRLPDLEPVAEIGTIDDEAIAFTDDTDEAIVIGEKGIRAAKVRFRISETHHERSEGAALIINIRHLSGNNNDDERSPLAEVMMSSAGPDFIVPSAPFDAWRGYGL